MKKHKILIILSLLLVFSLVVGIYLFSYFKTKKRILLSVEYDGYSAHYKDVFKPTLDQFNAGQFGGPLNYDQPNEYVKYSNKNIGIEFNVPYNKNWGNKQYAVKPYDEWAYYGSIVSYLTYGPLVCRNEENEPCVWWRETSMHLDCLPHINLKELEKNSVTRDGVKGVVEERKIGKVSVVLLKYNDQDNCEEKLFIIGNKCNYSLDQPLSKYGKSIKNGCPGVEETLEYNLDLIKSIKILD